MSSAKFKHYLLGFTQRCPDPETISQESVSEPSSDRTDGKLVDQELLPLTPSDDEKAPGYEEVMQDETTEKLLTSSNSSVEHI